MRDKLKKALTKDYGYGGKAGDAIGIIATAAVACAIAYFIVR